MGLRSSVFGENPLTSHAGSLFSLVPRLRSTLSLAGIGGLQSNLLSEIQAFEVDALIHGIPEEQVRMASYALCALVDEAILNTPWGAQSHWGKQGLSALLHGETGSGEKFFEILRRLLHKPVQHRYLLEFFFLCLSLGFQGKYRTAQGGHETLQRISQELFAAIERERGGHEAELSPHWLGLEDPRPAVIRHVPLWVVGATAAALLVAVYLGFLLAINGASDPLFRQLGDLSKREPEAVAPAPAAETPPAQHRRFGSLLAADAAEGRVEVVDEHTLRIRNCFSRGSDQVKPEFVPMLNRIASALAETGEHALVTGHTDDIPMRTVRFPSNFDLSAARAKHVADILLANPALSGKVRHEGRADSEPLVPNDSRENRAINRRVDILIR